MDIHQNARLTPHGRAELVRRVLLEGQTVQAVARDLGINRKTVSKWCARFQAEGPAGLFDRSSRPHRLRQPTPDTILEQIAALRRQSTKSNLQTPKREKSRRRFMPALRLQLHSVKAPTAFRDDCKENRDTCVYDRGKRKFAFYAKALTTL